MRLLSFITDIEHAVVANSPMVDGGAWSSQRVINFPRGLGRLELVPRPGAELPVNGATVALQTFLLANGECCIKARLSWPDEERAQDFAVYPTPSLNWKGEASRIAMALLDGPSALPPVPPAKAAR